MPKKGHTEEQIVAVLRQVEAGARVAEICRRVGIRRVAHLSAQRIMRGPSSVGEFVTVRASKANKLQ